MKKTIKFLKSQTVLVISALAAIISICFVPPSKEYLSYIDPSVIILLFCLMAAVAGLSSIGVFKKASSFLINKAGSPRSLGFIMMNFCFFTSMFITNDVALITFVPLTVMIFEEMNDAKQLPIIVVIETAASNLGSMLTPLGNPQNLYMYSHYKLSLSEFMSVMLPYTIASYLLLCILLLLLSKSKFNVSKHSNKAIIPKKQLIIYICLFVVCILTVSRFISEYICLGITVLTMLIVNMKLFKKIDYSLLLTFICFFIFVGNAGNIEAVRNLISSSVENRELIISALLSQFISNVPASIMLSEFTDNYRKLMVGINIGGLGTPIASLASLISYKLYIKSKLANSKKYLALFSCIGFSMLAVLLILGTILK